MKEMTDLTFLSVFIGGAATALMSLAIGGMLASTVDTAISKRREIVALLLSGIDLWIIVVVLLNFC